MGAKLQNPTDPAKIRQQKKSIRHRNIRNELNNKEKELHIAKMLIVALREENDQLRQIDTAKEIQRWEDMLSRLKMLTEDIERFLESNVRRLKRNRQKDWEY